jgi:manganese efflux pump family protein
MIVPLGLDTLAVSIALGARGLSERDRLRVSLVLTSFEAAMPLLGLLLGRAVGTAVGGAADYLALGILAVLGGWMLFADEDNEERRIAALPTVHGWALIGLGLSVSVDELAMGFSIGLLHLPVWLAVAFIGTQAFLVAQLGMRLGARGAVMLGERAERLAGVALLGLALLLLAHRVIS